MISLERLGNQWFESRYLLLTNSVTGNPLFDGVMIIRKCSSKFVSDTMRRQIQWPSLWCRWCIVPKYWESVNIVFLGESNAAPGLEASWRISIPRCRVDTRQNILIVDLYKGTIVNFQATDIRECGYRSIETDRRRQGQAAKSTNTCHNQSYDNVLPRLLYRGHPWQVPYENCEDWSSWIDVVQPIRFQGLRMGVEANTKSVTWCLVSFFFKKTKASSIRSQFMVDTKCFLSQITYFSDSICTRNCWSLKEKLTLECSRLPSHLTAALFTGHYCLHPVFDISKKR